MSIYDEEILRLGADYSEARKASEDFLNHYAKVLRNIDKETEGAKVRSIKHYKELAQQSIAEYQKLESYRNRQIKYAREQEEKSALAKIKTIENYENNHTKALEQEEFRRVENIRKSAERATAIRRRQWEIEDREAQKRAEKEARDALKGVGPNTVPVSTAMRFGAGVAGATGNYRVASGLYAGANAAGMTGAGVGVGTAIGIGAAATLPIGAAGLVYYGKELNQALASMSTLLTPTINGFDGLSIAMDAAAKSAINVSNRFGVDVVDVVKSFKDALSSGVDAKDLERFGMATGVLATALGEDIGKTTGLLTSFKDNYNLTITEMLSLSDKLFNVVDVGKVNVSQMNNTLGRVIPIAQSAGISINDMLGSFAALTRGMSTNQAVTALGNTISQIISPSEKAKKAMDALGIAYGDAAFKSRTLAEVWQEILDKTGGRGDLLAQMFPEMQANRGISFLTRHVSLVKETTNAVKEQNTAVIASLRAQDTLFDNLGKKITSVANSFKKSGSDLGNLLNDVGKGTGLFADTDVIANGLKGGKESQYQKAYDSGFGLTNSKYDRSKIAPANMVIDVAQGVKIDRKDYKSWLEGYQQFIASKGGEETDKFNLYQSTDLGPSSVSGDVMEMKQAKKDQLLKRKVSRRITDEQKTILEEKETDVQDLIEENAIKIEEFKNKFVENLNIIKDKVFKIQATMIDKQKQLADALASGDTKTSDAINAEIPVLNRQFEQAKKEYMDAQNDANKKIEEEAKSLDASVKVKKDLVTAYLETITTQKTHKEIADEEAAAKKELIQKQKEEAAARGKIADNLRDELRLKTQAIDTEMRRLQAEKADLPSDKNPTEGRWVTHDDPRNPKIKIKTWKNATPGVSNEQQRDAYDARLEELRQLKYSLVNSTDDKIDAIKEQGPMSSSGLKSSAYAGVGAIDRVKSAGELAYYNSLGKSGRYELGSVQEMAASGLDVDTIKKIYKGSDLMSPMAGALDENKARLKAEYEEFFRLYDEDKKKKEESEKAKVQSSKDALSVMQNDLSIAVTNMTALWNSLSAAAVGYMYTALAAQSGSSQPTSNTFNTSINMPSQSVDIDTASRAFRNSLERQTNNGTLPSNYNTNASKVPIVEL